MLLLLLLLLLLQLSLVSTLVRLCKKRKQTSIFGSGRPFGDESPWGSIQCSDKCELTSPFVLAESPCSRCCCYTYVVGVGVAMVIGLPCATWCVFTFTMCLRAAAAVCSVRLACADILVALHWISITQLCWVCYVVVGIICPNFLGIRRVDNYN